MIKAVNSDAPPADERKPGPTLFTVVERRVQGVVGADAGHARDGAGRAGRLDGVDPVFSENVNRLWPERRSVDQRPAGLAAW